MDGEQNNMNTGAEGGGSAGPIIGIIIILAIIILGGLYFWGQRGAEAPLDETLEAIGTQNAGDDTASIEADLNATDVENLDAELNAS
jgi:HAMP domain-containing protein